MNNGIDLVVRSLSEERYFMTESTGTQASTGIPRKKRGESFSDYWRRLTDDEIARITRASRWINVTPQSLFKNYAKLMDDP